MDPLTQIVGVREPLPANVTSHLRSRTFIIRHDGDVRASERSTGIEFAPPVLRYLPDDSGPFRFPQMGFVLLSLLQLDGSVVRDALNGRRPHALFVPYCDDARRSKFVSVGGWMRGLVRRVRGGLSIAYCRSSIWH